MSPAADRNPFTLRHDGRELAVEQEESGFHTILRLLVDGEPRAERRVMGDTTLEAEGIAVEVALTFMGRIRRCLLADGEERIPFDPPAGSRAERRVRLQREHPVRYTALEGGRAVAGVLVPLLGIGALLRLLVPKVDIDLPDVPLPDVDLPDVMPDVDLPSIHLPGWLDAFLASGRYWIPVLIAVGLAIGEIRRQRRKQEREAAARPDPGPRPHPSEDASGDPDGAPAQEERPIADRDQAPTI